MSHIRRLPAQKLLTLLTVVALLLASCAVLLLCSSPVARAASQPPHRGVSLSGGSIPPACSLQAFSAYPSPNAGLAGNVLNGIAASASNDMWAVGGTPTSYLPYITYQPLIEHFDGAAWTIVPSPNPGANDSQLFGISQLSSTNAWAVGYQQSTSAVPVTGLVEHWDGTQWSVVPSANAPGTGISTDILGISALSATDIWAVGISFPASFSPTATFTEHWDGSSWSVMPSPSPVSPNSWLRDVAGVSSTDVWAVGFTTDAHNTYLPLVEHWNGSAWSVVPTPSVSSLSQLYGVTALSSTDVWVVGFFQNPAATPVQTLIEHWNGTAWSIVPSPNINPGVFGNELRGIAADSASDIWAVGDYDGTTSVGTFGFWTLVLHWDGTAWSIVPSTSPGGESVPSDELYGVVALSPTQVWAVGGTPDGGGVSQSLVEHAVKNPIKLNCP